jgi:hypothetical protein
MGKGIPYNSVYHRQVTGNGNGENRKARTAGTTATQ